MKWSLIVLLLLGCAPEGVKHLDKATVQDEQGRLYRLQHGLGDNFSILPLSTNLTFKVKP